MPTISRFFGITIRMYAEHGGQHHLPHFHVSHQDARAIYSIHPVRILAGSMPVRQHRLVLAWVALHEEELLEN